MSRAVNDDLARDMAFSLAVAGNLIDLDDEGSAIQWLVNAGYGCGDIEPNLTTAIQMARKVGASVTETVSAAIAMVAAAAVWLGWYCTLCPPVLS